MLRLRCVILIIGSWVEASGQDVKPEITITELIAHCRANVPRCSVLALEFEDTRTTHPPLSIPASEIVSERFGFWTDGERVAVRCRNRSYANGFPKFVFTTWGSETQELLYLEDKLAPKTILLLNHPQTTALLCENEECYVFFEACETAETRDVLDPWDLVFNPGLGSFAMQVEGFEMATGMPFLLKKVQQDSTDPHVNIQYKGEMTLPDPGGLVAEIAVSVGQAPFGVVACTWRTKYDDGESSTSQHVAEWHEDEAGNQLPYRVVRTTKARDGSVIREVTRTFHVASVERVDESTFSPESFFSGFPAEVVTKTFDHGSPSTEIPLVSSRNRRSRVWLLVINILVIAVVAGSLLLRKSVRQRLGRSQDTK